MRLEETTHDVVVAATRRTWRWAPITATMSWLLMKPALRRPATGTQSWGR